MPKKLLSLLLCAALLLSQLSAAAAEEITVPDEPGAPTLSASVEGVLVRWEARPGETEYQLQRRVGNGDWAELASCAENEYLDRAVQMGETCSYRLRALCCGGWEEDYRPEAAILFNPFADVPSSGKTLTYVSWAFNNGVVTGTSGSGFSPDDSCTRVQFVMMLWKLNGSPEAAGENPFTDVSGNKTTRAVLWALDAGVINSGRTFRPNDSITRVQIVMILWKLAGSPEPAGENPFRDVKGAKTAKAVLWAYEQGITKGTGKTSFSPDSPCTRLQLVVFLCKYDDKYPVVGAPTLKLQASAKTITLSWSAFRDASQYVLYIKKDEGNFSRLTLAAVSGYSFSGVYGHRYTFKVAAVLDGKPGESSREQSAALIKTPARPELRSVSQEGGELRVSWYTVSGATSCELFLRESGSEDWRSAGVAPAADKTLVYRETDPQKRYELFLQGVNETGLGVARGPRSLVESTEPIELSVRPGFFSGASARSLLLEWTKPSDCARFGIYAKEYYSQEDFALLGTTEDCSFTFEAPKYATRYTLRVVREEDPALRRPVKQSAPTPGDSGSFEQLNYERVLSLPSWAVSESFIASRIDAISFVGDDLWYLKSSASARTGEDDGYYPVVLFHVADFRSSEGWRNALDPEVYVLRDESGSLYRAEHDSSLTYDPDEGCFYVVTCGGYLENGQDLRDCPVVKVSPEGVVLAAVPAEGFGAERLSTLAYCGRDAAGCPLFWTRDGKRAAENGEYHRFSLGRLSDGVLVCTRSVITEDVFEMTGPCAADPLPHSNDIHYEDGKLYHSVFVYDEDGRTITKNWLYVIDVEHPVGELNGMDVVPTLFWAAYELSRENSSETAFEIEGVACWQGEVYLGVNVSGMEDGLFRVKDYRHDGPVPEAAGLIPLR